MLKKLFSHNSPPPVVPKEGDLYKILHIHGQRFELAYGYYEACERENPAIDPMPIYPDFIKNPRFTNEGYPFVTKMQDTCAHYDGKRSCFSECAECYYYSHGDDLLGVCVCPKNKREDNGANQDSG